MSGKHTCPHCQAGFNRPHHALWPPGAKWYVPRAFKPQCPHCQGFLRDRLYPQLPVGFMLGLIGAVLAAQAFLPKATAKWALALLLLIYLVAHLRARERKVPAHHRYAKEGSAPEGVDP